MINIDILFQSKQSKLIAELNEVAHELRTRVVGHPSFSEKVRELDDQILKKLKGQKQDEYAILVGRNPVSKFGTRDGLLSQINVRLGFLEPI